MKTISDFLNQYQTRRPGDYRSICPACSVTRKPENRTEKCLSISVHMDGKVLAHCHNCYGSAALGKGVQDAQRRPYRPTGRSGLPQQHNGERPTPATMETPGNANQTEKVLRARAIWESTVPIKGTLAARYLRDRRGLSLPLPEALRFNPNLWHGIARRHFPAMVAAMVNPITGEFVGVHRTYLTQDGQKVGGCEPRLMLGASGVVCLTPFEDVTLGISIAEGIETALTVLQIGWAPMWACLSASSIKKFPVLPRVEAITVFADHDPPGLEAARIATKRWEASGCEVSIITTLTKGQDFNTALTMRSGGK